MVFHSGGGVTDMTILNVTVLPHPVVAGKNFSIDLDLQNSKNAFLLLSGLR